MWPGLLIVAVVLLGVLHLWWRQRFRQLQRFAARENQRLQGEISQAMDHAQAREQALFNSMTEGVLVLDGNDRIQLVNRAWGDMFGVSEIPDGKTLIEAARFHELAGLSDRVKVENRLQGFELRLPGPDERWICVNASVITGRDGSSRGKIFVFHDLTRLKQLERTREEFVANVSHELRTPLSMIKGYVETLLGGAKDDPETAEKFLRVVERHADRLALLIEDLLAIAQLESGQLQLHLGTIDLRAAAARGVEEFSVRAGARQVTLHNEIAAMEVLADPERLHQVLSNLIDNAIKYGRPGGNVWVSACAAAGGFVEVCVRDDGPGIQPSSVARVFERFYRADKARSREQGGTGLGLSIVKHLVLAQGGQVWVESEPGRGAAFRLTLRAPGAGASLAS